MNRQPSLVHAIIRQDGHRALHGGHQRHDEHQWEKRYRGGGELIAPLDNQKHHRDQEGAQAERLEKVLDR